MTVVSAFRGHPFLRLEACDGTDSGDLVRAFPDDSTVRGVAAVHPGRYFVLAGSDRVPAPGLSEQAQPEPLDITLAPLRGASAATP